MKEVLTLIYEVLVNCIFATFKHSIQTLEHFLRSFEILILANIKINSLIKLLPTLSLGLVNDLLHDPLYSIFPIQCVLTLLALITDTCARHAINVISPILVAIRLL